ncbi:hypothetical protein ACA910_000582 [Epithemia clementina (nom. ined.)]
MSMLQARRAACGYSLIIGRLHQGIRFALDDCGRSNSSMTSGMFGPSSQRKSVALDTRFRRRQQGRQRQQHLARCSSNPPSPTPDTQNGASSVRQGLYSIPELMEPNDFRTSAEKAMETCDRLCSAFDGGDRTAPSNRIEAVDILYRLDEISRVVCNVIDAAELCRSTHYDADWRLAANDAFTILSDYIGQLNANVDLYWALQTITSSPFVLQLLTEEEQRFARLLQSEFEQDGIHLPDAMRQQVRALQNSMVQLEGQFQRNLIEWNRDFDASRSDVESTIPRYVLSQGFGIATPSTADKNNNNDNKNNESQQTIQLNSNAQILQTLLKYSPSPSLRKQVYMEYNTAVPENLHVLQELRKQRHELATTLLGFESYADRVLANNKMAKSTTAVQNFLHHLAQRNKPLYQQEMALLTRAKRKLEGVTDDDVEPWDVSYYSSLLKAQSGYDPNSISQFLTLRRCLEAIQILCRQLFGIQMMEQPIADQDRWDGSPHNPEQRVRCFVVHEEATGRPLGTMYLDLHPRPGKYGHAAHFTVRCGCIVNGPESIMNNDSDTEVVYQLPIVALVCNLSSSSSGSDNEGVLSHGDVETLFHEMGHALHSLLSRTSFQHVSGTRTSMDFVETPSHLIENYVWDPTFLKILAVHPKTGLPIPDDLIGKLVHSRHQLQAIERQTQILYALFDQELFGKPTSLSFFSLESSTEILAHWHKELNVKFAPGTHWHSRFGHLMTYGAGYYSYLYAQEFAKEIWKRKFQGQSLNLESGQELWHKLLIHGGSKDPHVMLQDLLG